MGILRTRPVEVDTLVESEEAVAGVFAMFEGAAATLNEADAGFKQVAAEEQAKIDQATARRERANEDRRAASTLTANLNKLISERL